MRIIHLCLAILTLGLAPLSLSAQTTTTYVGNPNLPNDLQNEIITAYLNGSRHITINPGIYVLAGAMGFTGLNDTVLFAYGVELAIDNANSGAIVFENCHNMSLMGPVLRQAAPRTGQAKIVGIGSNSQGDYCDVKMEPGFPADATFSATSIIDGNTLLPKSDAGAARVIVPLPGEGRQRIYWNKPTWKQLPDSRGWPVVGDYLVCRTAGGFSAMCYSKGSRNCTFADITIYWGVVFGFYETHSSSGNRFVNCTITYGPVPPGGNMRALVSQSADGLHSGGSLVGPILENCLFEGMMDDGVNIHGHFYKVGKTEGNRLTLGFPSDFLSGPREYEVGDFIVIYDSAAHTYLLRTITAIKPTSFTPPSPSRHARFRDYPMKYIELELDGTSTAPYDSVAWFPSHLGAGYRIIGCTVRNSFGRGFLLKADNGELANNTVERTAAAGIVLSSEMNWAEAGMSHNVIIRNNRLRGCGYLTINALGRQAGGMVLTATDMPGRGHKFIQIRDNLFENIDLTNLIIQNAQGVTVSGNRFVSPMQKQSITGNIGAPYGIDSQAVVWVDDSSDVSFCDDTATNLGPYAQRLLSISSNTSNVQGSLTIQ